mgnify:CR=1 FL=1
MGTGVTRAATLLRSLLGISAMRTSSLGHRPRSFLNPTRSSGTKISRLMKFSRDKKLIWSARQSPRHFHILTTNGKPSRGPLLR